MRGKRNNDQLEKSPTDELNPPKTFRVTRSTIMTCRVCLKQVGMGLTGDENEIVIICRKCFDLYHGVCVGITSMFFKNMIEGSSKGWVCYNCNQDSLVYMAKLDKKLDDLSEKVDQQGENLKGHVATCERAFIAADERMTSFESRINTQVENMKRNMAEYDAKLAQVSNQSGTPAQTHTQQSTSHAKDVNFIKDLQRRNNLIVHNIPHSGNETQLKLKEIIVKLANTCGSDIQLTDIISVFRLKRNATNQNTPSSSAILVKFIDVSVKDEIFRGYVKNISNKTLITSAAIGTGGNQRIFINHHLSPELMKAKMIATKLKQRKLISKISANYNVIKIFVNDTWLKIYNVSQLEERFPEAQ